jgi:hypothetical protein
MTSGIEPRGSCCSIVPLAQDYLGDHISDEPLEKGCGEEWLRSPMEREHFDKRNRTVCE